MILAPNPFLKIITILGLKENEKYNFRIINYMGKLIYENKKFRVTQNSTEVNLGELENGFYIFIFSNAKNVYMQKMIKE